MNPVAAPPATRPRDSVRTRDAILQAAQRLFADQGYTTTGVREIAAKAGFNSALVRRYFGSKEGLLRAALQGLLRVDDMIGGERADFGRRAAATLLTQHSIANPVAIMMLAMADRDARALCCELVDENVILPLARWLGGPDAMDRAAQLNILWTGVIVQHHLMPLHHLRDHVGPAQQWVAATTQAIADGTGPVS